MKRSRIFLVLMVLALASLACGALTRGGNNASATVIPPQSSGTSPEPSSNENGGGAQTVNTDFPLTPDAFNVTDVGEGSILYYTKLSLADVLKFYRDAYAAKGYKEREAITVTSDTTLSVVFDGDPSGKSVVIQSVDLGNGSRTVSIRLEVVN